MWLEAPTLDSAACPEYQSLRGPGSKSAHKACASERLLCKSQASELLLRRKISN